MQQNKNIPVSILLLIIYALFMCQEIVVNQVLCYKDNADVDLELAIMGFQCECKKEKPHFHFDRSETLQQLCANCFDCFDLPLENNWIKRNINIINLEINFVKEFNLGNQIFQRIADPVKSLPESVPKSKFLCITFSSVNSPILRC